ncbi:MAG: FHA domain-containing protein [Chloroflexi bacterium]|nr:MAG: FHA domain-containing protein [Chloroflexota bacterium]
MLPIDAFLLILRLLFLVLLYLFLMQVVIAITRDLRKAASTNEDAGQAAAVLGHLVVVDSGPSNLLPGTRFDLAPLTTIGRGPTNVIRLDDPSISAENTRLSYRNRTWYVQDAGSRNGTFVNNQQAREAIPAKTGDIVRVGYIQFKLTQ